MTFNVTTIEFAASIAELEEQIEELTERLESLDEGNPLIPQIKQQRSQLKTQRKGAVWARDRAYESEDFSAWDEDVDAVTLGGVRAGAFAGIESEARHRDGEGTDLLLIADGTVDAPYIDDGMSDEQVAAAVGQLHPYYRAWASGRIDEIMDPEAGIVGNANESSNSHAEN